MSTARPTIRDVAAAAGVSVTTVSHTLNGKGRVDPLTRARVLRIAASLGYAPNRSARSLRSGRSGQIALALPATVEADYDVTVHLDYYMRVASAAASAALVYEHALILVPPRLTGDSLPTSSIDGAVIVDPSPADPRLELFDRFRIPIVSIERDPRAPETPWYVASDSDTDIRRVLDHLAEQGAERIAIISPRTGMSWARETVRAYRSWTTERSVPRLVINATLRQPEQSAYSVTMKLLQRDVPDAIIAVAERHIRGMLRAVRHTGLRSPADIMLVAGVDGPEARDADPPLTALDLRPDRQADAAIGMLMDRLSGHTVDAPLRIEGVLNLRASTARPTPASNDTQG